MIVDCKTPEILSQRIKEKEHSKRVVVIQACKLYKNWPNLSVKALASCIDWRSYSVNTGNYVTDTEFLREPNVVSF